MAGYSINLSNDATDFDDVQDIFENIVRALRGVSDTGKLNIGTLILTDDAGKTTFLDADDVPDETEPADVSDVPEIDETTDPSAVDTDEAPDNIP